MNTAPASQPWAYGNQPQQNPTHNPGVEELTVIQEPERAKVVVKSRPRERKAIDPPPVVELNVRDERPGPGQIPGVWIHSPYYICVVCLWDSTYDQPYKPEEGEIPLYGSLVSSLNKLKNLQETEGAYFVFGDISVGVQGRFRLCFNLYSIDPWARSSQKRHWRGYALSRPFDVTSAREWEGVKESTSLSRSFADQGVRLRLRKETRGATTKRTFGTTSAPYTPMSEASTTASHDLSRSGGEDDPRESKRVRSFHSASGASEYSQPSVRGGYYGNSSNGHPYSPYGSYGGQYSPTTQQQPQSVGHVYPSSNLSYAQGSYPPPQQSPYPSNYAQSNNAYPYASHATTFSTGYTSSSPYGGLPASTQYPGNYAPPAYSQRGSDQPSTPSASNSSQYSSQAAYSANYPPGQSYTRGDPMPHQIGSGSRHMANPASTPTLAPLHRTDQYKVEHVSQGPDDGTQQGMPR